VKHWGGLGVIACALMNAFTHALLMLGGFAAAAAVAMVCLVGLVVWLAGGKVATRK